MLVFAGVYVAVYPVSGSIGDPPANTYIRLERRHRENAERGGQHVLQQSGGGRSITGVAAQRHVVADIAPGTPAHRRECAYQAYWDGCYAHAQHPGIDIIDRK